MLNQHQHLDAATSNNMDDDDDRGDDTAPWDVYEDLSFLFVHNDALHMEFSYVCDLLSEPAGGANASSRPISATPRELIKLLRQQVDDLKVQLLTAQENAASRFNMNVWKRIARLATQASLRVAAIHEIADRQYRRQQSAIVKAGLVDHSTDDIVRATPMPQADNSVLLEYVYHITLAAPYDRIGDAVWNVFKHGPPLPDGATQSFEQVDEHTVYQAFRRTQANLVSGNPHEDTAHANIVWKYIQEPPHHQVVVWRAVVDDALVTHMANGAVHDEWGWYIVADPVQAESRGSPDALVDETMSQVETFSFVRPPTAPGMFPGPRSWKKRSTRWSYRFGNERSWSCLQDSKHTCTTGI
ncbi:hypothetical protein DYB37_008951 [Aphanomyces astaci]|uniref:START domain-containing protein n=1 Tax=Aphanomyces astaci TaxID=112090 RepID=A0A3R7B277_APHAT|nr:hypothetical protein DYB37_008951 [Aphanomyces astaci]